jgi:preprotein translocase subunit SecA
MAKAPTTAARAEAKLAKLVKKLNKCEAKGDELRVAKLKVKVEKAKQQIASDSAAADDAASSADESEEDVSAM